MEENNGEHKRDGINWDWGKGLTLAIVLFVVTTLSVVGYIVSLDYHMVTENHYEKAENYQEHIDRIEQTGKMADPVEIEILRENQIVQVRFPKSISSATGTLKGTVELYRPSNSSLDRNMELLLNRDGIQNIEGQNLAPGKWIVKVKWSADGKNYYKQESIFL